MAVLRRALYCTPLERAWIRERAADVGMPVSRFVVACALKEDTEKEPGLVLSEEEQRLLYDRVERLDTVRRGLMDALPGTGVSLFGALAAMHRALSAPGPDD